MQESFLSFIYIVIIRLNHCFFFLFLFLQIFSITSTIWRSFIDKKAGDILVFLSSSLLSLLQRFNSLIFLLSIASYYGGLFYIKSFFAIFTFDGIKHLLLKSLSLHRCFVYRKFYEDFISVN